MDVLSPAFPTSPVSELIISNSFLDNSIDLSFIAVIIMTVLILSILFMLYYLRD